MKEQGAENERWAKQIVHQLVLCGVRYFCLSPGSRSTALAIAVQAHYAREGKPIEVMVHFDERAMAFHALGYAHSTATPVALVVTTGTASGNLLPAIMEASQSHVPLIVLTADRPPELRDIGSNQTIDQVKLFSDYVRWQTDLPCSDASFPENYLATVISQAVFRATYSSPGPVHLNCMFREPLFAQAPAVTPQRRTTIYEHPVTIPAPSTVEAWANLLSPIEQGIIVVGRCHCSSQWKEALALSEQLQWPIFADVLSPLRLQGTHPHVIAHYDLLMKQECSLRPQAILHLGDRLVSKALLSFLNRSTPPLYLCVADHPSCYDPNHQVTHRLVCDPFLFCKHMKDITSKKSPSPWLREWMEMSKNASTGIDAFFEESTLVSEPGILYSLTSHLTPEYALFLSNSMPVRDADALLFPRHPIGPIFCNRGVSGIDGNIATAVGIAQGTKKMTVALLGDLATLHDLNSLALVKKSSVPLLIIIFNNQGGGIFSFLPIAQRSDVFEEFIATPHPFDFKAAAEMFHLPYTCLVEREDWDLILSRCLESRQSHIIEVRTDRNENFALHQELQQTVRGYAQI